MPNSLHFQRLVRAVFAVISLAEAAVNCHHETILLTASQQAQTRDGSASHYEIFFSMGEFNEGWTDLDRTFSEPPQSLFVLARLYSMNVTHCSSQS